jgi:hypothetical protein
VTAGISPRTAASNRGGVIGLTSTARSRHRAGVARAVRRRRLRYAPVPVCPGSARAGGQQFDAAAVGRWTSISHSA